MTWRGMGWHQRSIALVDSTEASHSLVSRENGASRMVLYSVSHTAGVISRTSRAGLISWYTLLERLLHLSGSISCLVFIVAVHTWTAIFMKARYVVAPGGLCPFLPKCYLCCILIYVSFLRLPVMLSPPFSLFLVFFFRFAFPI